jgi:hypothetical protein
MNRANVRSGGLDPVDDQSDEDLIDVSRVLLPLNRRNSRLPHLVQMLDISVPNSPSPPPRLRERPRLSRETVAGVHALVGLVRQVQLRILARTVRAWHLKPIRLRSELYLSKVRLLEDQVNRTRAIMQLLNIIGRTATLRGMTEFWLRLKLTCEKSDSDIEWESASEHIQKLRDLLAIQLITSATDKFQIRQIHSVFLVFQRLLQPVA